MTKSYFIIFICTYFTNLAIGQTNTAMDEVIVETSKDLYIIRAKLIDNRSGAGAAGKRAYVTVPGRHFEMRTAMSDSSGYLLFLMKDIEGLKQLIFQTNTTVDSIYTFEFGTPLAEKFPSPQVPDASHWPNDTLPFYGKADKEYFLDDYVRFPTMEEVIREYIPEVNLRRQREQYHLEVYNTPFKEYFINDPLVLLDGVPVFDINLLMALDPLKIKNLQIVARKYYYGSLVCNGIVNFISYENDMAGFTLPRNAVVLDINNLKSSK